MATSKQPKQPAFPHPPLEIGVAQYPTPAVPDYYTKSGHIILVVKESIEKGSYTPKPLDGSVTYAGRDANKWPSTLYLVYQQPTPDGEYVYNTYANDRTLASQDPWNYGIDYSLNDPSYPITSRTYIVPRSQYSAVSKGSTDPIFGGSQIITQQKMLELPEENPLRSRYVAVQRVYETLPSPIVYSKEIDPLSNTNKFLSSKQAIARNDSNTPSAVNGLVTEYADVDAIKSTKTIKDFRDLIGKTWTEYETISYTFPALLSTAVAGVEFAYQVGTYIAARSLRVRAKTVYTISDQPDTTTEPITFVGANITTNFGTYSGVIHNFSSVIISHQQVFCQPSLKVTDTTVTNFGYADYVFGQEVVIDNSSVLIKGYGGLYLIKTTSIHLH
jgi:hypothetical protein